MPFHARIPLGKLHILLSPTKLYNICLYSIGPFFGAPHKFHINRLLGSTYADAYEKFERDHRGDFNVKAHVACLAFQLFMNFRLLESADRGALGDVRRKLLARVVGEKNGEMLEQSGILNFGFLTMSAWMAVIWIDADGAMLEAKVIASLAILLIGYLPRKLLSRDWDGLAFIVGGFCDAFIYPILLFHRPFSPWESLLTFALLVVCRVI